MLRKCGACGDDFLPIRSNSFYCSKKCQRKSEYYKNRERYIIRSKEWYAENLERARKNRKAYYWSNPEKHRQKTKEYWDKHREEKRLSDRLYKDRIRHGEKREKAIQEQGAKCSVCGKVGSRFDIPMHHLVDKENHELQILICRSCHARIHMTINNPRAGVR